MRFHFPISFNFLLKVSVTMIGRVKKSRGKRDKLKMDNETMENR